jgi:5-(carboxyamino)imidazole ribonucleotide synthase
MSELPPSSLIGVLGGGQLGRFLVQAGHELGFRLAVLDPSPDCPAGKLADFKVTAGLDERAVVRQFARAVPVLTYETEALSAATMQEAEVQTTVAPGASVFRVTSDRLEQRTLLSRLRIPTPAFRALRDAEDLSPAHDLFPARLKVARNGFDGRGQLPLRSRSELRGGWEQVGRVPAILERNIELTGEFSIIVARSRHGDMRTYEPIRNVHRDGILRYSLWPAGLDEAQEAIANVVAVSIAEALDVVGLLCVEFFINSSGRVLVNEFASRPHNSGHLTIEAAETSQFSQHIRAVTGMPLASPRMTSPAAMVNLLGIHLPGPPVEEIAPGVFLHRYGKLPRPNRKVGHITALAETSAAALVLALEHAEHIMQSTPAVPA